MFSFLILLWEVFQVVIAVVASIVFLVFAGLTLAGSAVALSVTTPLFVIFSPILVPATIATAVLTTGFTAGSTLGATAIALIRRSGRMGVKPKMNLPPPTAEGSSSAASAQTLIEMPITGGYGGSWGGKPFSGTFGNGKSAGGTGPAGGFGGSWGGKPFSWTFPGWFGGIPAAAGGSTPAAAPPSVGGSTPPARKT